MIKKGKQQRKNKIKSNNNKKIFIINNNKFKNRDPAFQTNQTLKKYINEKLKNQKSNKIINNKRNESNKKYKIEVNKIKHSKSLRIFTPLTTTKDNNKDKNLNTYIYYKKNSKILSFLNSIQIFHSNKTSKIFNTKSSCFSDNNSNNIGYKDILYTSNNKTIKNNYNYSNTYNNFYKTTKHKYSVSTFSSSISYKDINNNINHNQLSTFTLSPTISQERINVSLTSRAPYKRVGKIFNRNECQFSKNKKIIKNNIEIKNKLLKKCKSVKYHQFYTLNNNNEKKIKELEEQNLYLKRMIKISEKKLNMRKTQLDNLLMLQSQVEDKNCPIPMKKIKKIISPITEIIENKKHFNTGNLNKENNNIFQLDNNKNEELISEDLEEPFELVPPKPYIFNYLN